MSGIARKGKGIRVFAGLALCWTACGIHAQSASINGGAAFQVQTRALHKQVNDATPAVNVTGSWRGTNTSPGDPAGTVWDEEVELHQDASGNVSGTRRSVPEQNAVSWINWAVTGTVSGATVTLQDTTLLGRGNTSLTPCVVTVVLTASSDGNSLDGNWTSPTSGCQGGTFHLAKLAADPAKNLGDGGRCDGGEGITGGTGKSGSGGSSSSGPTCDSKNGSTTTGNPSAGDPINFSTGNFFLQEDDYVENGWLTFRRFYNSDGAVAPSQSGSQWRHSFNRSLMIMGSPISTIVMYRPDGQEETFTKSGAVWSTELAVDRLTENDDAQGNPLNYAVFVGATRRTETYDTAGKLISVVGENGEGITLTYSTNATPFSVAPVSGLLIAVTDPKGRQLKFAYFSNIKINSVTLPDGGLLQYGYSLATGDTAEVIYPDGKNRQYLYNESSLTGGANLPNSMTGIQDEAGNRYESISYDSQGRATSSVFTGNVGATHIAYNADGSSSVTYPLGHVANLGVTMINGLVRAGTVDQPCGPDCQQPWKSRTYDANGYPASYTDFNNVAMSTTYDTFGLLEQQVEAVGTPSQRTTTTSWDFNLRKRLGERVLDAQGNTISLRGWAYDTVGNVTASCEMDTDNVAALAYTCSAAGAAPAGVRRTTYTYCTAVDTTQCPVVGLLLTAKGPRSDFNQTTTYSYYLTDMSTARHGDLKSITDALGHTVNYASYDGAGRVTRMVDQNGVVRDFTYTQRGWLLTVTIRANADGTASSLDAKTTIAYTSYGAISSTTDADGVVVKYSYDNAHRVTKVADNAGNFILYTLDAVGNTTLAQTGTSGGILKRSSTNSFNVLGQLTGAIDGLNHAVFSASASGSYDANGNLANGTDGLSIQRHISYDELNRVVSIVDNYSGSDIATANTTKTYAYDALGRVEGVTDPDGLSTTYDFDGLNNAKATHSPATGTSNYLYDIAGNLTQATDAKSNTSTLTYDALDRVSAVSYSDTSQNVTYGYDEPNGVTGCSNSYPIGHLTRVVESSVTTVYCYDNRGNVVQKRQVQGAQADTIAYAYTLANHLSQVTYPSGTVVQYARNNLGQITSVTTTPSGGATQTVVSNVTYLPFGPVSGYTLGNSQSVVRNYDANYRLLDLTSPNFNLHFTRDVMGDVTSFGSAQGVPTPTETYSHDPLYRLTGVLDSQGNVVESYTYNKTGDRLSKVSTGGLATGTYGYQSGTHWLTSIGSAARSYDLNGNTTGNATGGQTFGYGYNNRNRLTVAQANNVTVGAYTYNALGERVAKSATSPQVVSERFAYQEDGELLSEYGSFNREYVWMDDLPVAAVDGSGATASINFLVADGLGTPRSISNASGTQIWTWQYQSNPFGEKQPTSISGYAFNLRYPGQYFDAERGVAYNANRDYDSTSGRYLQSDPTGLDGGINTYSYVEGRPLSYIDPMGLDAILLVNTRTVNLPSGKYGGHAAVAIGNDETGWTFYQEGGIVNGIQETTQIKFATLNDLEVSITHYINGYGVPMTIASAYDSQQGMRTQPLQDILMNTWAQRHLQDPFDGQTNNCGDFALGVLRAGGLHPTSNSVGPTIPNRLSIGPSDDPNRFAPY